MFVLVQHMWEHSTLLTELIWTIFVLIPKGSSYIWGIGLLEVLCKLVEAIIDNQTKTAVKFHDILRGFFACIGAEMAIM